MKQFQIIVYLILFFFLQLLLSCGMGGSGNPEKKSARDYTKADSSSIQNNEIFPIVNPDTEEFHDAYWQNENMVGSSQKETKQSLAKKYNSLLVFHAEDTMEVNKTYLATLALAKNADIEAVKLKVLEASDATSDNIIVDTTIQLGKRMRAKLLDLSPKNDKSFTIEKISPDEQNLTAIKEAYWQWNIEPLKEGNHELKLSVQVILGDGDEVGLPARDIPVTIFAKKVSFISKLGNFFGKYWQWIITGILIPLFIGFYTNWLKQRPVKKKNQT